jgi:hypothetical protein
MIIMTTAKTTTTSIHCHEGMRDLHHHTGVNTFSSIFTPNHQYRIILLQFFLLRFVVFYGLRRQSQNIPPITCGTFLPCCVFRTARNVLPPIVSQDRRPVTIAIDIARYCCYS